MELTTEQLAFIRQDIINRGITLNGLADSLADHICCCIEADNDKNFPQAYQRAIESFGENGLAGVQQETVLLLTLKKEETMKKAMYILGYLAAFLFTTGLLFKLQHWPGAAIMLTLGVALLNLGFLPLYFYGKYKSAVV